jgi:alpha-L-rhamnosidase
VADWLHRAVGGLAPASPGYKTIEIKPVLLDGIDSASTSHETPYGLAGVEWRRDGTRFELTAVVPANTTAAVWLPGAEAPEQVGSGRHTFTAELAQTGSTRHRFTLDSPLDRVVEDPEAYQAVIRALDEADPERAASFRRRTRWVPNRSLRSAMFLTPPPVLEAIEKALAGVGTR